MLKNARPLTPTDPVGGKGPCSRGKGLTDQTVVLLGPPEKDSIALSETTLNK